MNHYFHNLLALDPATLAATYAALAVVCQFIGKMIPETATGWQGTVRKIAKVLGLYVSNRIEPGVSTSDVAKAQMATDATTRQAVAAPSRDDVLRILTEK